MSSRRTLQGCWERTDHEAEFLQDYRCQPLPGSNTISKEGTRVEGWRSTCTCTPVYYIQEVTVGCVWLITVHIYQSGILSCTR